MSDEERDEVIEKALLGMVEEAKTMGIPHDEQAMESVREMMRGLPDDLIKSLADESSRAKFHAMIMAPGEQTPAEHIEMAVRGIVKHDVSRPSQYREKTFGAHAAMIAQSIQELTLEFPLYVDLVWKAMTSGMAAAMNISIKELLERHLEAAPENVLKIPVVKEVRPDRTENNPLVDELNSLFNLESAEEPTIEEKDSKKKKPSKKKDTNNNKEEK